MSRLAFPDHLDWLSWPGPGPRCCYDHGVRGSKNMEWGDLGLTLLLRKRGWLQRLRSTSCQEDPGMIGSEMDDDR